MIIKITDEPLALALRQAKAGTGLAMCAKAGNLREHFLQI